MKLILFFATLIFAVMPSHAQSDYATWKRSVVSLIRPTEEGGQSFGTGFFVTDTTLSRNVYLVSNRHILAARDSLYVRVNSYEQPNRTASALDFPLPLRDKGGKPLWTGHFNDSIDVAVVPVRDLRSIQSPEISFEFSPIDISSWLREGLLREGMRIMYVGFPEGLGIGFPSTPILRSGSISLVSGNFLCTHMVLLEAHSVGGNSGSPVFFVPELAIKGDELISQSPQLIGIIKGHMESPRATISTPKDTVTITEHLGLSFMFTVESIKETISYSLVPR